MFRFRCTCCDEWHEGMPGYSAEAPLYFYSIPAEARGRRCSLDADTCIVDDEYPLRAAVWRFRSMERPNHSSGESGCR